MRTLNLGILAHVDAGKTSLTERLLHAAGVIDELGSVDDGSTQTDTLALERRRGITIKSAVVSFVARRRHRQPDRHARPSGLHRRGRARAGRARRRGARRLGRRGRAGADARADARAAAAARPDADVRQQDRPRAARDPRARARARSRRKLAGRGRSAGPRGSAEVLADHDDALLADYVDGALARAGCAARWPRRPRAPSCTRCSSARRSPAPACDALAPASRELLPAARAGRRGPVAGTVFKVERGPAGEKIAYVRMRSGTRAHARPLARRRAAR